MQSIPSEAAECPLVILRDAGRDQWLRFARPRRVLAATRVEEVMPALDAIEDAVASEGLYAAGFVSYEAAPAFDPALVVKEQPDFPLLWFGLFEPPEVISLPPAPAQPGPGDLTWQPSITPADYDCAIERIKRFIRTGDTYQVNFSYRLRTALALQPGEMFRSLLQPEAPPYAALIETGDWAICSASPELFFQLEGTDIESRPMKGTRPRGLGSEQDRRHADELRASPKDQAENVMIVDMVRNDLGRIAEVGSVSVPALFQVEQYPTVWQMTSTVRARTGASVAAIFQALFPPASITGAPKPRTMEIIAALESTPRRIYTGAIGFLAPGRRAQFNVAIRTLLIDKPRRQAEYGVGGGIIWDSQPEAEQNECRVKARILRPPPPDFDLLESILWTPEEGYSLLDRHLTRLEQSASFFNFKFDLKRALQALDRLAASLPPQPLKARLRLARTGSVAVESAPPPSGGFGKIALAGAPVDASNPLLYHKTTQRQVYQHALATRPGAADVLLFNDNGEVTESTIANVAVEIEGACYTPPVRCGLLPGTYRAWLLGRNKIQERVITLDELRRSSGIFLFNSVRGMGRVRLVES